MNKAAQILRSGMGWAGSQDPTETLRKEMEKMMDMLEPGTKGDIQAIKDKVFGPQLFWVTDAKPEIGKLPGAYLVRPDSEAVCMVVHHAVCGI